MTRVRRAFAIPAILLAGCVTTEIQQEPRNEIDPQILAEHEARLVKQFRSGNIVLCKTLDIEANLFVFTDNVTLPVGQPRRVRTDQFEQLTWSVGDKVEMREKMKGTNRGAKPTAEVRARRSTRKRQAGRDKFRIMVGATTFIVDDRITVRRLFRAPPTLTAHAKGHVMVIRNGKDASNYREVRFVDGRVEAR